eukprot:scaffold1658_cov248-Chaetoceros_neogracile.AAC.3
MSTLWCAVFSTNSESVGAVIQAALTSQGFNKSTFEKSNFGFQYEARRHSDPLTRNGTIVSHYFVFVLLSQILMMWVEKKPNALVGTKLVVMHGTHFFHFDNGKDFWNTTFGPSRHRKAAKRKWIEGTPQEIACSKFYDENPFVFLKGDGSEHLRQGSTVLHEAPRATN